MKIWYVLAAVLLATAIPASAADVVRIGAIYPLTGNAASAGASAKDAVELGAEIVNNARPELPGLPLAATAGLPNLGGARIELVSVDHQGNPQVGQNQTLRLITQEKVVAVLGAYHSSVALVSTAVAERQGIPFLVADSVALNITGRGFKWVFRTGPIASDRCRLHAISHRSQ
jgi:branched-chain amino acid transport system substrate-binding protein